jgi:hypothetical protein
MGTATARGGHADGDCVALARYLVTWVTSGHGMAALSALVIQVFFPYKHRFLCMVKTVISKMLNEHYV